MTPDWAWPRFHILPRSWSQCSVQSIHYIQVNSLTMLHRIITCLVCELITIQQIPWRGCCSHALPLNICTCDVLCFLLLNEIIYSEILPVSCARRGHTQIARLRWKLQAPPFKRCTPVHANLASVLPPAHCTFVTQLQIALSLDKKSFRISEF